MDSNLLKHYGTLGLRPGVSLVEMKSRARGLFMKYHPDLNPHDRAGCEEKIKEIIEAYKFILGVLSREPEVVADVSAAGTAHVAEAESAGAVEALVFELSHRLLATPTAHVLEIVRVKDVKLDDAGIVHAAFPFVSGVFRRGGDITMLWNLHKQLRLHEPPISSSFGGNKIMIVEFDGSRMGFLVDEVRGIMSVSPGEVREAGDDAYVENIFLDGMVETGDGPVGLINLRNILYNNCS